VHVHARVHGWVSVYVCVYVCVRAYARVRVYGGVGGNFMYRRLILVQLSQQIIGFIDR